MRYIIRHLSVFIAFLMLSFPASTLAIELLDVNIPVPLKNAYYGRLKAPEACIADTEQYIKNKQQVPLDSDPVIVSIKEFSSANILPIQLLAFCYAQIEDYQQAYQLLNKLSKQQSFSAAQLRTLDLLATEIPAEQRPDFNNQLLIKTFTDSLRKMEKAPFTNAPNLEARLLLVLSNLSLQSDLYRSANIALQSAKEVLNKSPSYELNGWLAYYYGVYYSKINQHQLAVANLFSANKISEKHHFIQLSGETKKAISELYEQKHLFKRAIDFSVQRVELYINTDNRIKQAESLIELAILKGKNENKNQSLVYLFNALELIQDDKHSTLLARTYLELGRTYSQFVTGEANDKERVLAQKYLQNARYHFTRLKEVRYQVESLLLLAQLNLNNNDPALAILQLEKVLQLSEKDYSDLRVRAFDMLAASYELTGNHQQANVHFKNFYALQNRIKERLFALQQLQINEQLQLIELTQQQRQLEIENNVLKSDNVRFKALAYGGITLLIMAIVCLFNISTRNRKLISSESRVKHQLNYHPRTKLPSQQAQGNDFNYIYYGEPLYYALVNAPFLDQLNAISGLFAGAKLERQLGQTLLHFFSGSADIFQIRGNQILFISEQKKHLNAEQFAQQIELIFHQFTQQHNLKSHISIGIVAFPFLNNVSRAITPTRMLNLSSLALFAANQLLENYQQSSWLELYAIDNLQPAFFDGDLWELGQKAIQKGIVKINSSQQNHHFYWPELDR